MGRHTHQLFPNMVSPQPADVCWLRFIAAGVFFRRCLTEISDFTTAGQFRRALYSHILYFPFLPLFDPGHTPHHTLRATSKHKAERPFHHQPNIDYCSRQRRTMAPIKFSYFDLASLCGACHTQQLVPTHTYLKKPRTAFFAPRILTPACTSPQLFSCRRNLASRSGLHWR